MNQARTCPGGSPRSGLTMEFCQFVGSGSLNVKASRASCDVNVVIASAKIVPSANVFGRGLSMANSSYWRMEWQS